MKRPRRVDISRTVGVIVCMEKTMRIPPFKESNFFLQLAEEAEILQLDMIVFSPREVDWEKRLVRAWIPESDGRWTTETLPLPKLIYDRCYYTNLIQYKNYQPFVAKLRNDPQVHLLGRPLGGKIQTHEILKKNEKISSYLPETIFYQSPEDLLYMIQKYKKALIKPNGGSHGVGVAGIIPDGGSFFVRGRTPDNRPFQRKITGRKELTEWVQNFIGQTRYIVQPFLSLTTSDGSPFDIRILLQKDEQRKWARTGLAIRIGKANSITSNLHGGGDAKRVRPFLREHFPANRIANIWDQINLLSTQVPKHIEENHGRMVELGLDLGIDRKGKVWILELNSKPGRSVFLRTGELETRRRAIQLPMQYANSILSGQIGGKL